MLNWISHLYYFQEENVIYSGIGKAELADRVEKRFVLAESCVRSRCQSTSRATESEHRHTNILRGCLIYGQSQWEW